MNGKLTIPSAPGRGTTVQAAPYRAPLAAGRLTRKSCANECQAREFPCARSGMRRPCMEAFTIMKLMGIPETAHGSVLTISAIV